MQPTGHDGPWVHAGRLQLMRRLAQTTSADSATTLRLELELTHLLETGQIDRYAEHLTADHALTTADGQLLTRSFAAD